MSHIGFQEIPKRVAGGDVGVYSNSVEEGYEVSREKITSRKKDPFLKYPLALLHHSSDPLDHFYRAELFAVVNAGIGFRKKHDDLEVRGRLGELEADLDIFDYDEEAFLGAWLCGITLKDKSGNEARRVYDSVIEVCGGIPTTNIRADIFYTAYKTAQKEADDSLPSPERWISWREYRILVATYSLQWNSRNFCEAGWESIRYRACGFHNKKLFQESEKSDTPWLDHNRPLSRDQIKRTIEKLEELKFFVRCRISSNSRHGGKSAYSIKHTSREALMKDVLSKQAYSRGDHIRENRANDLLFYLKGRLKEVKAINAMNKEAERIQAELEQLQSTSKQQRESTAESLKHSKPASHLQVGQQGGSQHNEKSSDEKSSDEKSKDEKYSNNIIPVNDAVTESTDLEYLLDGKILSQEDATKILLQNPNLYSQFRPVARTA
jgi:hypothetical protein